MSDSDEKENQAIDPILPPGTDKDQDKAIEAEVKRRLAEGEDKRRELARKLAVEMGKRENTNNQDGGQGKTPGDEAASLLKNVCGILNRGFSELGGGLRDLRHSVDNQFSSLSDNLETNFNELWSAGYDGGASGPIDDLEDEDKPPIFGTSIHANTSSSNRSHQQEHLLSENSDSDTEEGNKSKDNNAQANLSFFAKLAESIKVPSDVSEDLDGELAALINLLFDKPPSLEEFLKIKEKIKRPGNCESLQVPPVPEAIWRKIPKDSKSKDVQWQKMHADFLAFAISVLRGLDDLYKLLPVCPDARPVVEHITEAFKIAGFIHRVGFVEHRRDALKPDLPGEYKRLAGANFPPCPSSLFGEDLVENVKQISEVSKLSDKISSAGKVKTSTPQQANRYHPYARGRGTFHNARGFRGRGRGGRGGYPFNTTNSNPTPSSSQAGQSSNPRGRGFRGRGATKQQ